MSPLLQCRDACTETCPEFPNRVLMESARALTQAMTDRYIVPETDARRSPMVAEFVAKLDAAGAPVMPTRCRTFIVNEMPAGCEMMELLYVIHVMAAKLGTLKNAG